MRVIAEYRDFRPDVIHGHTFYGLIYGLALKSLSGRPLVYMVPAPQAQIKMSGFGWIRYAYRWGHRWVDRFFIPPAYRSESTSLGVPSEKIVDFLLYVDGTTLAEAAGAAARHRADVRAGLGIPEEAPILLSVGRLDTEKGHEYAAAALPAILCRFPQIHWVILGDGKLRSSLEDLIGWLGIGNAVHFVGFRDEPVPFYAAADLYLRTTIFEGDNLSSALAVGVGLPAVGFDVGADNDLLRRAGHGLLVANRDTAALSAAVIALLSSVEDRRALGQRGLRYGKDHLTISAGVQPFLSAYLEFACRT
jgi:glycosyltransferase involved in cell wall biosynthesis